MDNAQLQIIIEALGAALLGGIIGLEREASGKPAGLRTYILITTSACLLVNFGTHFVERLAQVRNVTMDPLRMIEAIVAAVGFIGGGMLIKSREGETVTNLTTAALTLFSATVGISMALKLYYLAIFITLFSLIVSFVLYRLEEMLPKKISPKG